MEAAAAFSHQWGGADHGLESIASGRQRTRWLRKLRWDGHGAPARHKKSHGYTYVDSPSGALMCAPAGFGTSTWVPPVHFDDVVGIQALATEKQLG